MFTRRCRYCKSYEVYVSRRLTIFEAVVLPFLLLRPYRCNRCLRRQTGFRFFRLATARSKERGDKT